MKEVAIAFLEFYRNSNWLHEFKSDEQLWEEFNNRKCKCINVEVGSYSNQVELPAPGHLIEWADKVGFSLGGDKHTVCIDKCLEDEIKMLWNNGIITTGCCCGHNKNPPYIGVDPSSVKLMKAMGYKEISNGIFEPILPLK